MYTTYYSIGIKNLITMSYTIQKNFIVIFLLLIVVGESYGVLRRRKIRDISSGERGLKAVNAPLLDDYIDLDTIRGVEQLTKLVLIKTDSSPGGSNEQIDGRYLNSLIETLYTGLRKPFKSVSADILGIFPSFEEIQVHCDRTNNGREQVSPKRQNDIAVERSSREATESGSRTEVDESLETSLSHDDLSINETSTFEQESSYPNQTPDNSALDVCKVVTDDCLPMDRLIKILPSSEYTFDRVLVRLCPVMLFRIMNQLCRKSSSSLGFDERNDIISAYQNVTKHEPTSHNDQLRANNTEQLSNLLRETKLLKNLQNSDDLASKRPQKLHKKLKTQKPFKSNSPINSVGLQQRGSVDEQLLKIRLKLTEPSIEKVWIFSLLFVILSIVVSMGGLIVLPFVRKTTRRRILTLFEGLAVGGLTGSATLHMFPQAFGLVDENYHKYFWRIFVVFFGIYLCYLCERIIKIVKAVKARIHRRSRASLAEMDFYYGFSSVNREFTPRRPYNPDMSSSSHWKESLATSSQDNGHRSKSNKPRSSKQSRILHDDNSDPSTQSRKTRNRGWKLLRERVDDVRNMKQSQMDDDTTQGVSDQLDPRTNNQKRQRLVECLSSVRSQFSPVYFVPTQLPESGLPGQSDYRGLRRKRVDMSLENGQSSRRRSKIYTNTKNPANILSRLRSNGKFSNVDKSKQGEVDTMLNQQLARQYGQLTHGDGRTAAETLNMNSRLSRVDDVAAGRQDQDFAARISVDTVAWMIVFGDAVLNVIDGLSIGAAFERNILAGISISVAVMLEEVTHRLGTFAVLIRAGLVVGILLSDATEDATPYIFCAAGGIFLYMALVDVMKEMNRSIENAMRKDIKSTLQIFALQNVGIVLAVIFLSFLALYEQAMDFEEYQMQYNHPT